MYCFDICCCTYNSTKWLSAFFAALCNTSCDKKCLRLYFADNNSSDNTVSELNRYKSELGGVFGAFEILPLGDNYGFGTASNRCAEKGESELIFFLNIDTELAPDAFEKISAAVKTAPEKTAVFELRQFPHEHPKFYNPATLLTSWASGAALVLKRSVFRLCGGFDESIFMYCEDVDLSWRIRLAGFNIMYVPSAITLHHTGDVTVPKPTQLAGEIAGEKILRLKYGTKKDIADWQALYRLFEPQFFADSAALARFEKLNAAAEKHKRQYRAFYKSKVRKSGFCPVFDFGYEFVRHGAEYINQKPEKACDITFAVLCKGDSGLLSLTFASLANQTEKHFKTAAVLYGGADASAVQSIAAKFNLSLPEELIFKTDSADKYAAANAAISGIETEYACILNEGDCLFADGAELISLAAQNRPDCDMLCGGAVQAAVLGGSGDESENVFYDFRNIIADNITPGDYFYNNPTPLCAVCFKSSLFKSLGGFDLTLGRFADWELWLRFSSNGKIAAINKTVCLFCVPGGSEFFSALEYTPSECAAMQKKLKEYSRNFSAFEISSIVKSEKNEQKANDFAELEKTAAEISGSSIWKIAAPLRALARLLRRMALGLEKRYGIDLPQADRKPKTADFSAQSQNASLYRVQPTVHDTAEYVALQRFANNAQTCGYMQKMRRLRGGK